MVYKPAAENVFASSPTILGLAVAAVVLLPEMAVFENPAQKFFILMRCSL